MRFHTLLLVIAVAVEMASAVTLRNFRTPTCKGNYIKCSHAEEWECCVGGPSSSGVVRSSLITGLPPTGLGAICTYRTSDNHHRNACGSVKDSASGLSVCVGYPNGAGSMWFDCSNCRRDGNLLDYRDVSAAVADQSGKSSVEPDRVAFEGHEFKWDSSVPADAKQRLTDLYQRDAGYDDIPADLKKYEVPVTD
ncbi:hypothetical protein F4821DRAFT_263441 [Hypoxylon rubiginosum]|uniref:Uncharacterized protein n=1 Tax=Hypoxylon rubiginosum TaxID=110542 RepID=A0ACC0CR72_9PEZI|nr:hypothetical protein F4821DRAFT_263441 [Hypoxylon rubiginosum]